MSFNIPKVEAKRIVVVGGGFGGLRLCTDLVKNPNYQVVLIDRNNFHQFPPLIYQIATSGLQVSSIAFPFRKMFAGRKNFFFRMCELRAVFPNERFIQTSIGKLEYDMLIIATGTTTNYFGNTKIQNESMPMKTINESLGLRNALLNTFERATTCSDDQERAELLNIVIVGGGPTGVEVAGALAEMRDHVLPRDYPDLDTSLVKIHLIQGGQRLLPAMSEKASRTSLKYLTDMDVDVQLRAYVTDYSDHEVRLKDGRSFKSQTIIWVCGVTGRRIQGIDQECYGPGNRLIVDEYSKVQGLDGVYAIGDCALMRTETYPNGHPQMAQASIQQGANVAANIIREGKGEELKKFAYRDLGSMATIGRNKAVADIAGMNLTGFIAWFLWMVVHLMSILGVKNKISAITEWAWSYFTYDKSNRTIIAVKHPKVILQRNYEISMRHWGELTAENEAEAKRITAKADAPKPVDTKPLTPEEEEENSASAALARAAIQKAAAALDRIQAESLAAAQAAAEYGECPEALGAVDAIHGTQAPSAAVKAAAEAAAKHAAEHAKAVAANNSRAQDIMKKAAETLTKIQQQEEAAALVEAKDEIRASLKEALTNQPSETRVSIRRNKPKSTTSSAEQA